MFLGYQDEIPTFIANTREELENKPCIFFDDIIEVPFAEMFNGVIYTDKDVLFEAKTKAVEETRAGLYTVEVDPITAQINRLRDEEQTPETVARIEELKVKRSAKVEEIKTNNPYPTVEENLEPSPITPVVAEPVQPAEEFEQYSMEI